MKKNKPMSRSENMSRIRGQDTKIEITLRKELWARGIRYRKNDKTVYGKPDIVFKGKKIAVFCDSEFWHGYEYLNEGKTFKTNTSFWEEKMKRNIERDRKVNQVLKDEGWMVLRFWEKQILQDVKACADQIQLYLDDQSVAESQPNV